MRIFEIVKENVNLREAVELYGIDVNRYGKALCPFHNDRHPSLYVADDHYHCFACGEHGDVIDFVGRLFQLSPYDAAQKLMADFHLSPDKPPSAAALHAKRIREQFVSDGMCADAAIHDTDGHNPHAHILLTVRPLDEQGKWQYKTEKEYLCMKNGEEQGFTAAEFRAAQNEGWEKQYPYKIGKKKVYMTPSAAEAQGLVRTDKHPKSTRYGRQNPISERWNSEEQLAAWRAA